MIVIILLVTIMNIITATTAVIVIKDFENANIIKSIVNLVLWNQGMNMYGNTLSLRKLKTILLAKKNFFNKNLLIFWKKKFY